MNPLRQPANAPAASAITIAMSTIGGEHMRGYAHAGSRRGRGGIKLDEVSKGYDRRAFLKVMGLGASAAALAACGGGAGTATTSAPAGTQAAAPTAAAGKPPRKNRGDTPPQRTANHPVTRPVKNPQP